MLKGRFYQALLPNWQRKLGTPKTDESFEDLYPRARAFERHDQQIGAGRQVDMRHSKPSTADEPSKKTNTANEPRTSKNWHSLARRDDRNKSRGCFHCGEVGHIQLAGSMNSAPLNEQTTATTLRTRTRCTDK